MCILTDQSADISRGGFSVQTRIDCKQRIQLFYKSLLASHQFYKSFHIVRNKPGPLPGGSFAIVIATVSGGTRVEWGAPFAIRIQSAHETGRFVEIELIGFSETFILCFVFEVVHRFGKDGDTPVVVGIFQCFGYRFIFAVAGDVADSVFIILRFGHQMRQHQIGAFDACRVIFGCPQTGFVCFVSIKIAVTFHIGIHDNGDRMISDHRSSVVGSQIPHWVYSAFLMFPDQ